MRFAIEKDMGVILLLMTILGAACATVALAFAIFTKRTGFRNSVVVGAIAWCVLYAIALVGLSFLSEPSTIAMNQPKVFCGFYIDCHLHASVTDVRKSKSIGNLTARGEFNVVTVRVFSDARDPSISMRLLEPSARVLDGRGLIHQRDTEAEKLLPSATVSLDQDVKTNEPFEKEIVFDLPDDAFAARLDISEAYGIDKFIEAILIGDEDSLWHARKYLSLEKNNPKL
ncbi:MAG: hypothetical protein IPN69_07265 [Acidobacteria bacterium]|nr:hypothetical protein [Acidobacteriota bacterium]